MGAPVEGVGVPVEGVGVPVGDDSAPRRAAVRDRIDPPVPSRELYIITSVMMITTEAAKITAMIFGSISIYDFFFEDTVHCLLSLLLLSLGDPFFAGA